MVSLSPLARGGIGEMWIYALETEGGMATRERERARTLRFAAWTLIVLLPLASPLPWVLMPWAIAPWMVAGLGLAGSGAMMALLQTTPPDAIRLRRATSIRVIALGWCWMASAAAMTFGLVAFAPALLALLLLPVTLRRMNVSPWAAAPATWHPAPFLACLCMAPTALPDRAVIAGVFLGAVVCVAIAALCIGPGRGRMVLAWILWMAGAAATLVGTGLAMAAVHARMAS